jgi:phasin family protein
VDQLAKSGSPVDAAAKQAELTKQAFEKGLANARELAEMVAKANQDATSTIQARISATLDEIKEMTLKLKERKA